MIIKIRNEADIARETFWRGSNVDIQPQFWTKNILQFHHALHVLRKCELSNIPLQKRCNV